MGSDGVVHKLVVDKMMPDQDEAIALAKTPLAAKVALILGLLPRDSLNELGDFCACSIPKVMLPLERIE